MGKLSEKELVLFIAEFAWAVEKINSDLLDYEVLLRYGNSIIYLPDVMLEGTLKEIEKKVEDIDALKKWGLINEPDDGSSLSDYYDDEDCEGYLVCYGDLYDKMYGYEAYGKDIYGDGDEAKQLYNALEDITDKHGLWYEWCSRGILLYAKTNKGGL